MVYCLGKTKAGKRCQVYLTDPQKDYCKWHDPKRVLCKGKTRQGQDCRSLADPQTDYCKWHDPKRVLCKGKTRQGQDCRSLAKTGLDGYCRRDHDPRFPSTETEVFRIDGLRHKARDVVMQYRDHRDAYTGEYLPTKLTANIELDHVVEIQIVRDVFDTITKPKGSGFPEKKKRLRDHLRDHVINETKNLNFTETVINKAKFEAVDEFLQARKNPESALMPLFHYLQTNAAKGTRRARRRETTKRIQKEIYDAADAVVDGLEIEQPLHKEYQDELILAIADMKLK